MQPVEITSRADPPLRARLTLAVVCLGYAMVVLDTTIVNVALPVIQNDLQVGLGALQWAVDGYVLMLASLLLSGGTLVDRLGSARVFRTGVTAFTVASALCGLAPTSTSLVIARLLQGGSAAMMIPASMALIAQAFPEQRARANAVALFTTLAGSPQAFGPALGGVLVGTIGWRSIFFLNVPLGLSTLLLTVRGGLPERTVSTTRSLDLVGQSCVVLGLASLTTALIEGHAEGWLRPLPIGAAVVAAMAFAAFAVRQRQAADPLLPPSLLRAPGLPSYVLMGLLLFAAYYGLVFALSLYLQQVRHVSAFVTGLTFLPSALPIFLLPVVAGRLAGRFGARPIAATGLLLGTLGALDLLTIQPDSGPVPLAIMLLLLGCGVGLTVGPQITLVIGTAPASRSGIASGLLNAGRQAGYVLGVAVLGSIAGSTDRTSGLHTAAITAAVLLAVALAAMARHPARHATSAADPG